VVVGSPEFPYSYLYFQTVRPNGRFPPSVQATRVGGGFMAPAVTEHSKHADYETKGLHIQPVPTPISCPVTEFGLTISLALQRISAWRFEKLTLAASSSGYVLSGFRLNVCNATNEQLRG
jgi:hypothetical protein